jgi:hypothetical protein
MLIIQSDTGGSFFVLSPLHQEGPSTGHSYFSAHRPFHRTHCKEQLLALLRDTVQHVCDTDHHTTAIKGHHFIAASSTSAALGFRSDLCNPGLKLLKLTVRQFQHREVYGEVLRDY